MKTKRRVDRLVNLTAKDHLYLEMYILPTGKDMELRFSKKKSDPVLRARGEGSCLIFELIDMDLTPAFSYAMEDGKLKTSFWFKKVKRRRKTG